MAFKDTTVYKKSLSYQKKFLTLQTCFCHFAKIELITAQ